MTPPHIQKQAAEILTDVLPWGAIQGNIVRYLVRHYDEWVDTERLVDAAYSDDRSGGPMGADQTMKAHIYQIRRRLEPWGMIIEGTPVSGRRLRFANP